MLIRPERVYERKERPEGKDKGKSKGQPADKPLTDN